VFPTAAGPQLRRPRRGNHPLVNLRIDALFWYALTGNCSGSAVLKGVAVSKTGIIGKNNHPLKKRFDRYCLVIAIVPILAIIMMGMETPAELSANSFVASPVASPEAEKVNLVLNGGFERGIAFWYVEGATTTTHDDPHSGKASLVLGTGEAYADQRLRLQPGTTYVLFVWGKMETTGDAGYVGLSYRDRNGDRLRDLEPRPLVFTRREYSQQTISFEIDASVEAVTLYTYKENGTSRFFLDDVVLNGQFDAGAAASPVASPIASSSS
jgi:hypothetical protein